MRSFLLRWFVVSLTAAAVLRLLGSFTVGWLALAGAALMLGLILTLVRPLTLRFTRSAFGWSTFFLAAAISFFFFLVLGSSVPPYGFPSSTQASAAAAVVTLVSWAISFFFRSSDGHVHTLSHPESKPPQP